MQKKKVINNSRIKRSILKSNQLISRVSYINITDVLQPISNIQLKPLTELPSKNMLFPKRKHFYNTRKLALSIPLNLKTRTVTVHKLKLPSKRPQTIKRKIFTPSSRASNTTQTEANDQDNYVPGNLNYSL